MKIKHIAIIATLLTVMAPAPGALGAQPSDAIDALSRRIAASSSALRSQQLRGEAEIENLKADNRLPDAEVEFESLWTQGASKMSGSLTQGFEFPTAYKARSRAAQSGMRALDYLRAATLSEKTLEAKLLILDYIYQTRRLETLRALRQNLDSLAAGTEKGYRGGEMTILDLRKIRIEQANLLRDIAEAEMAAAQTAGSINAMADGGNAPVDFTAELNSLKDYPAGKLRTLEYYEEKAMANNPALKLNAAEIAVARDMQKVASAERLPSFGVGYAFEREEGRLFNGFTVSMTLPFWKGSARGNAAKLEALDAELRQESAGITERARIRALYKAAEAGERRLTERESALGELTGNDSWSYLLKRALDAGRISMLEYLNETNYFIGAMLQLEEARHAQALLLAELAHKCGTFEP